MKIVTFWRMTFQQKLMFISCWYLCGVARVISLLFSWQSLSFFFGKNCRMTRVSTLISQQQIQQALQIKHCLQLAVKYTPWQSKCLVQALVAVFWCRQYHLPYMLFIGLVKNSDKPLGQEGHAWVTAGPVAISGGHSLDSHHVVSSFSNTQLNAIQHDNKGMTCKISP